MPGAVTGQGCAKDEIIEWFRGEFAAANAIIDSLCSHVAELEDGDCYESVFTALHRRRMHWIPILQMQKHYSIADVATELRRVAERRGKAKGKVLEGSGEDVNYDISPEIEVTDTGSHEGLHPTSEESTDLCSNHEECDSRSAKIKLTKGFTAEEHVEGHMVNVVRGLRMYENVFTDGELSKLNDYLNKIRVACHKGEHSGGAFILNNQQMKGKKREPVQFGAPIFEHMKEEATEHGKSCIEPIPPLLQSVIDHLVHWQLIPDTRKPDSCIINFFDEGEFSRAFLKPAHLEQPISTLVLSDSMMAFGQTLVCDNDGNYKGSLMLSLKEGSILDMRGNSSDMARHAMCPAPNKRVSITFFKVRRTINQKISLSPPQTMSPSYVIPNGALNSVQVIEYCPEWNSVQTPLIMFSQAQPIILTPIKPPQEGTGVFLPWTERHRKPPRRHPPRAQ